MADTKMTKTIGEHWVCATLARLGWAPALTRDGIGRTDILAVGTRLAGRPRIEVQVKAAWEKRKPDDTNWPLGKCVAELAESRHEWFVLVLIPTLLKAPPRGFVVPRDHVSAGTWIAYQQWKIDPTARRKRTTPLEEARIELPAWQGYEDQWELLGTPTTEVPILLPIEYRELAQKEDIGLPDGHPWNNELPEW